VNGEPLTRIEWAAADSLPFPLFQSSITDPAHGYPPLAGV
jgi:hypothetical protein